MKNAVPNPSRQGYIDVFGKSTLVKQVPTVHVDLSLAPAKRWEMVMEECNRGGVSVEKLVDDAQTYVDSYLPDYLSSSTNSAIGRFFRDLFMVLLGLMCSMFYPYYEDILALSSCMKLSVGELFLVNLLYEILGGCTSFICSDRNDKEGRPMIGRTLDWPCPALAKHTVQFIFLESKEVVFQSVAWVGYVGVLTGVKPGKFAIALNARYPDIKPDFWAVALSKYVLCAGRESKEADVDESEFVANVLTAASRRLASLICGDAWTCGTFLRTALTRRDTDSFKSVCSFLLEKRLVTPCYFIVAGNSAHEGIVISRDCAPHITAVNGVPAAMDNRIQHMEKDSYQVQTNHDTTTTIDDTAPPEDFNSIDRYEIACQMISRNRQAKLTPTSVALILTTTMNQDTGVRMKMTLYFSVIRPYLTSEECIVTARPTRSVGP